MRSPLMAKLNPQRLKNVSPAVASMLGIVLRADFTTPCFDRFEVAHDGGVFMSIDGSTEPSVFVGDMAQVQIALTLAASLAGLSTPEFAQFEELCKQSLGSRLFH